MSMDELACFKYQSESKLPLCGDNNCKIGKKRLCKTFINFAKHVLKKRNYLPNNLSKGNHKDIENNTIESIFKRIDRFRGREGFMEGAFMNFCKFEYRNRFGDFLRKEQEFFEGQKVISEQNLHNSGDDDDEYSLLDTLATFIPAQKRGGKFLFVFEKPDGIKESLLLLLDSMESKGNSCSKLIVEWIFFKRKYGYNSKEISNIIGMDYSCYRQSFSRCLLALRKRLPIFIMIQKMDCKKNKNG